MARLTRANLKTKINDRFPDNTVGLITPAKARDMMVDIVDSFLDFADNDSAVQFAVDFYDDLDNLKTGSQGNFYIKISASNKPSSTEGYLVVICTFYNYVKQIFYQIDSKNVFVRDFTDGVVWTPWQKVDSPNPNIGEWNTTDELPTVGSGDSGAIRKFDRWVIPSGGWTYNGQFFPQWSILEAMVDDASTFEDFKYPY